MEDKYGIIYYPLLLIAVVGLLFLLPFLLIENIVIRLYRFARKHISNENR